MSNFYRPSRKLGIGTLAALGVFVMGSLHRTVLADTVSQVRECNVNVYAKDPDPRGLNVRQGPGSQHAVLALIHDSDARFEVTGSSGKWLRIRQAAGPDGTIYFNREGWIFSSLTAVRANKAQTLRANPGTTPDPAGGKIAADEEGSVQSCEGKQVQIQTKKTTGWLAPDNYCGNPVTGCV
jgi:SH3-like domain-containing protein